LRGARTNEQIGPGKDIQNEPALERSCRSQPIAINWNQEIASRQETDNSVKCEEWSFELPENVDQEGLEGWARINTLHGFSSHKKPHTKHTNFRKPFTWLSIPGPLGDGSDVMDRPTKPDVI
jgi:hypothetical protein